MLDLVWKVMGRGLQSYIDKNYSFPCCMTNNQTITAPRMLGMGKLSGELYMGWWLGHNTTIMV